MPELSRHLRAQRDQIEGADLMPVPATREEIAEALCGAAVLPGRPLMMHQAELVYGWIEAARAEAFGGAAGVCFDRVRNLKRAISRILEDGYSDVEVADLRVEMGAVADIAQRILKLPWERPKQQLNKPEESLEEPF